jgi:hypothetical protein
LTLRAVADIRCHGDDFATTIREFMRERLNAIAPPRAQHDLGALRHEKSRAGFSETAACAGDDNDFLGNIVLHDHRPFLLNRQRRYCASLTFSIQSTFFPLRDSCTAMCVMAVVGVAPC